MDLIFVGCFLAVLCLLGISDYKTRKLGDTDIALLWLCLVVPGWTSSPAYAAILFGIAGLGMALTFTFSYAFPIWAFKKPLLRGGDVMVFPPFLAFSWAAAGFFGMTWAAFVLGISLVISYKRELPFATVLLGAGLLIAGLGGLFRLG